MATGALSSSLVRLCLGPALVEPNVKDYLGDRLVNLLNQNGEVVQVYFLVTVEMCLLCIHTQYCTQYTVATNI